MMKVNNFFKVGNRYTHSHTIHNSSNNVWIVQSFTFSGGRAGRGRSPDWALVETATGWACSSPWPRCQRELQGKSVGVTNWIDALMHSWKWCTDKEVVTDRCLQQSWGTTHQWKEAPVVPGNTASVFQQWRSRPSPSSWRTHPYCLWSRWDNSVTKFYKELISLFCRALSLCTVSLLSQLGLSNQFK